MFLDYARLAVTSLRKRRLRSWLTMIGVFIGIAAVVSLISLGQGMEHAIKNQFLQLGTDKITVQTKGFAMGAPGSFTGITLGEGDVRVVRHATGVALATARLLEPVPVEFNEKRRYSYLVSLPEEPAERAMVMEAANVEEKDVVHGRSLEPGDWWKVMTSEEYSRNPKFNGRALKVGDKLLVNGRAVELVGIFKKTGNPMVDAAFVMNEEPVRELLGLPDKVDLIVARVSPGASVSIVAENIEKDLRAYRHVKEGKEDFEVQTSEELLDTISTILSIVTAVLAGIAAISLLVGGVGIMNTMYTAVIERTKEIGIMKAIGARNNDILTIFLIESGLLGTVGGAIGIIIGALLSRLVETVATAQLGTTLIQAHFSPQLILGALAFSFLVGSAAGTFPALQASRLPPAEALRQ